MAKDFEIEIEVESIEESKSVHLPVNFLLFGEIESDDVKIYIKQNIYKELEKLASSDTSKELGSILLGEYCQEHGKMNVIISQYIEAKYTDASASTLTFTHKTWEYIHEKHNKYFTDKKIIGWQHTHPNYGIFLSNYDMFIQENFFNLPFQIAYVIDPIQNLRGFFQWKNGRIEKLKGYYIYDDVGKVIKIEQIKVPKIQNTSNNTIKFTNIFIAALSVAIVCLSIFTISLNVKFDKQDEIQKKFLEEIRKQENVIVEKQDIQENEISNDCVENIMQDDVVIFKFYQVVEGDNLIKICAINNLDYEDNRNLILAINGIEDENQIYVEQMILLPYNQ